jgi:hypothetical protein
MKLPSTLVKRQGLYHNTAEEFIYDFTGYREVAVRDARETYPGQAKACIDNSVEFAEYGELDIVQGYFRIGNARLGAFHYWNQCATTGVYWDCSPVGDITYWIKDTE